MSEPDDKLADFLAPGIGAEDVPALFPLLRGRELLRAFTALFHGGEASVTVRLLVLRTLGARSNAPDWSMQEIREQLAFVDPVKLDTVLGRLKEHDLVVWDTERHLYRISPTGRKALAALSVLLQFEANDDDGLGYLTAQLAAGQAMGRVGAEELGHLLSRLAELKDDFDRAVLSGSEHRIRQAAHTLDSVWTWVEKGTEVIRVITEGADLDPATHRLAQAVGRAQSAMLRQAGAFQRALNQLDRDRVHLGKSGLSSSDLVAWLREQPIDRLCTLAEPHHALPLRGLFLQDGITLDVAEFELLERERAAAEHAPMPGASDAPTTDDLPMEQQELGPLHAWRDQLAALSAPVELPDLVPADDYAISAYRLSLLGLIGDPESAVLDGPAAELARLTLKLHVETGLRTLDHPAIALISEGRIEPLETPR
jgi:DNA-binding PadR family transcriptional regulator